jgi:uncharacterized protein (TIGR04255 family)
LSFNQELPQKLFQKVIDANNANFRNFGLTVIPMPGFQIDAASGGIKPIQNAFNFVSADRTLGLLVTPSALQIQTGQYVRWAPFIGTFEQLLYPIVQFYMESLSLIQIQLEYLDVYNWQGTWEDFDWRQLLREDSGFISQRASKGARQWHVHSGWFEDIKENFRRLVTANIDIVERQQRNGTATPAVTIGTLMREEIFSSIGTPVEGGLELEQGMPTLESLHSRLKSLLKEIIKSDMAQKIGL